MSHYDLSLFDVVAGGSFVCRAAESLIDAAIADEEFSWTHDMYVHSSNLYVSSCSKNEPRSGLSCIMFSTTTEVLSSDCCPSRSVHTSSYPVVSFAPSLAHPRNIMAPCNHPPLFIYCCLTDSQIDLPQTAPSTPLHCLVPVPSVSVVSLFTVYRQQRQNPTGRKYGVSLPAPIALPLHQC